MYRETRWQSLEHLSSHFPRPNIIPDSSPASLLVLQVAFGPVSEATGGTKCAGSWHTGGSSSPPLLLALLLCSDTASPWAVVLWHCTCSGMGSSADHSLSWGACAQCGCSAGCRACFSGLCPMECRLLFLWPWRSLCWFSLLLPPPQVNRYL